jgi:hypothetical protein
MDENIKTQLMSLSVVKELKDEIVELKRELESTKNGIIAKNQRKCWLDDLSCPYGNPEGKFQLRPTDVCRQGGCHKLSDFEGEFEELLYGSQLPTTVADWCRDENPITVAVSLLTILENESNELDDDEKVLVQAVAEMLNGGTDDYNPRIYYAKDLEESI